jgi:hypothetical protein
VKLSVKHKLVTSPLIACGNAEPPIEIEAFDKKDPMFGLKYVEVKVTAIEDLVTVDNVVVNRGNCKIENNDFRTKKPILPKELKFGESVTVTFGGNCSASEVEIIANGDNWNWEY